MNPGKKERKSLTAGKTYLILSLFFIANVRSLVNRYICSLGCKYASVNIHAYACVAAGGVEGYVRESFCDISFRSVFQYDV